MAKQIVLCIDVMDYNFLQLEHLMPFSTCNNKGTGSKRKLEGEFRRVKGLKTQ